MASQAPSNSDVTIANNRSMDHGHVDLERGKVQPPSGEREKKTEKPDLVSKHSPDDATPVPSRSAYSLIITLVLPPTWITSSSRTIRQSALTFRRASLPVTWP